MKTLNAGDTVSIGGKNYNIGGEEADVKQMFTEAKITGKAGDKVTINGKEFTYYDKAADGQTALKTAGFYAEQPSVADKDSATPAYASTDAIAALKSATISVGTKSIDVYKRQFQICTLLYTGSLLRRAGTGNTATACPHAVYGASGRLGHLDLPCTDISGYQLPVCAGHQYSTQLLCRNRRCQCRGCSGKRFQLSGSTCGNTHGCL